MSRFDGITNRGSYIAAQRRDWYAADCLLAAGVALPMDLVCSETQSPGDASTSRGMATTVRSSDRTMDRSASSVRIAADRIDGAA